MSERLSFQRVFAAPSAAFGHVTSISDSRPGTSVVQCALTTLSLTRKQHNTHTTHTQTYMRNKARKNQPAKCPEHGKNHVVSAAQLRPCQVLLRERKRKRLAASQGIRVPKKVRVCPPIP